MKIKTVYTAPENSVISAKFKCKIFLAGSIDMGSTVDWQTKAIKQLESLNDEFVDYCFYNPRRKNWDNSWQQSIDNPYFFQQVNWELDHLDKATHIIMYLDPDSKSPISLLELGLYAKSGKLLVVCPDGFYRKGNVDIICNRYNILQFKSIEEVVEYLDPEIY